MSDNYSEQKDSPLNNFLFNIKGANFTKKRKII